MRTDSSFTSPQSLSRQMEQVDEKGDQRTLSFSSTISKKDLSFNVWDINLSLFPVFYNSKGPRYRILKNRGWRNT